MGITVTSAPATEPITTAEAKAQLNITASDDDTFIDTLVKAAREWVERSWNMALITQTIALTLDGFPNSAYFNGRSSPLSRSLSCGRLALWLPRPPTSAVTSITYYDANGTQQTWSSALYQTDFASWPARVSPISTETWPSTQAGRLNSVTVTCTAGFGAASAVPTGIKHAIKLLVGFWYVERSAVLTGSISKELEMTLDALRWSHGAVPAF